MLVEKNQILFFLGRKKHQRETMNSVGKLFHHTNLREFRQNVKLYLFHSLHLSIRWFSLLYLELSKWAVPTGLVYKSSKNVGLGYKNLGPFKTRPLKPGPVEAQARHGIVRPGRG